MYASVDLLVVDDNPGDIRLYQEFFKANKFRNTVHYTQSYSEMIDYLRQESLPDVILMSMNLLTQMDTAALSELKSEPRLQHIPLVGLTSSPEEQTILQDLSGYVAHFMLKPLNVDTLYSLLAKVENLGLVISWHGNDCDAEQSASTPLNSPD